MARSVGGHRNHVARMRTKVCTKFQHYSFFSNREKTFCVLYVTWCILVLGIMKQRTSIKFYVKLQKSFTETFAMIQTAYGDNTLSRTTVHMWFKWFKEGRDSIEDNKRSGRLSTRHTEENIAAVRALLTVDPRLILSAIADKFNMSKDTVAAIIHHNMECRKIYARFVHHFLNC